MNIKFKVIRETDLISRVNVTQYIILTETRDIRIQNYQLHLQFARLPLHCHLSETAQCPHMSY
jgi:hypothetical protein